MENRKEPSVAKRNGAVGAKKESDRAARIKLGAKATAKSGLRKLKEAVGTIDGWERFAGALSGPAKAAGILTGLIAGLVAATYLGGAIGAWSAKNGWAQAPKAEELALIPVSALDSFGKWNAPKLQDELKDAKKIGAAFAALRVRDAESETDHWELRSALERAAQAKALGLEPERGDAERIAASAAAKAAVAAAKRFVADKELMLGELEPLLFKPEPALPPELAGSDFKERIGEGLRTEYALRGLIVEAGFALAAALAWTLAKAARKAAKAAGDKLEAAGAEELKRRRSEEEAAEIEACCSPAKRQGSPKRL